MSCSDCSFPYSLCQCPVTVTRGELATLGIHLKNANALIGRWTTMFSHERDLALRIDSERYLAEHPAAPVVGSCAEVCGSLVCEKAGGPDCLNRHATPSILEFETDEEYVRHVRAAAEQRALAALEAIPEATLQSWIDRSFATVVELAKAELARRKGTAA